MSKHAVRPLSEDSALMANHTNQVKNKDISYLLTAQTSAKHRSRNSRTNQELCGASSLKGNGLKHLAKEKESKQGYDFEALLDKLMVFKAGSSDDDTPSPQVDVEMAGNNDGAEKGVEAALHVGNLEVASSKTPWELLWLRQLLIYLELIKSVLIPSETA